MKTDYFFEFLVMSFIAWCLFGHDFIQWGRGKKIHLHPLLSILGPFTMVVAYIRYYVRKPQSEVTADEETIEQLRKMTETERQRQAAKSVGHIQRTVRPELVLEATTFKTPPEGYFHYFIVDENHGNKIEATSIRNMFDLSLGGYTSRDQAMDAGYAHLRVIASDPLIDLTPYDGIAPCLVVRTVASRSDRLRLWAEKLKDQKFPLS